MEVSRNNAVYAKQNNRNPFIDFPGLEQYIWGTASSTNLSVANYVDPYDGSGTGGTGGGESGSGSYYYEKVASASDLTGGQYLIVCENNGVAFDGSLTTLDATGNTIAVTIANNKINATTATEAAEFTIAVKEGGGYSIKSASGLYIGLTGSSNGLKTSSSDDYTNTITISAEEDTITCNSKILRYNATSGQTRFRYYGSGQTAIQLYKKVEGTSGNDPVTTTASFTTASKTLQVGGTFTQTVTTNNNEGEVTYSSDNTAVATVDSSTGLVTAIAEGTTTITATIAATNNYTQGSASYEVIVTAASSGSSYTDELTATTLELTSSYSDVTNKEGASGTKYAANAMTNANEDYIQLRSKNNSGIVSTTTIGTISKVTVEWNDNSGNANRVLNIYGSNSAYTAPSALYDTSTQGTLIGTIVYGTSTELTVADSYKYIGLRSNSGAMYINSINIEWTPSGTSSEPEDPSFYFSVSEKTIVKGETYTQAVKTTSDGEVTYTS
ncbi:MAG: Ig-like domain-containing protein, partial [Bacteroidaceae bacterium]|nr:Ig-like domain-containing protein [Bacteroidaceae bacterium]